MRSPIKRQTAANAVAVAVVVLSPVDGQLALLLQRVAEAGRRPHWTLPQDSPRNGESLEHAALRVAKNIIRGEPSWLEQLTTVSHTRRGSTQGASLTVAYVGLTHGAIALPADSERSWFSLASLPSLAAPDSEIVATSVQMVRDRMDHAPIAFRMLPRNFTLAELQEVYEILLGRQIHKASFRRALQAAWLVEPVDKWRNEGRGRPAQLYRYAPRQRRGARRSVRFDRLS